MSRKSTLLSLLYCAKTSISGTFSLLSLVHSRSWKSTLLSLCIGRRHPMPASLPWSSSSSFLLFFLPPLLPPFLLLELSSSSSSFLPPLLPSSSFIPSFSFSFHLSYLHFIRTILLHLPSFSTSFLFWEGHFFFLTWVEKNQLFFMFHKKSCRGLILINDQFMSEKNRDPTSFKWQESGPHWIYT